jgi:hypothetical protein
MGKGRPQCGPRGKHPYLDRVSMLAFQFIWRRLLLSGGRAVAALPAAIVVFCLLTAPSSHAFDLFTRHEVTAQFATPDGKPMAGAEVRVFAPGDPGRVALTGHSDAEGKFVFDADQDGLWSAEARNVDYVARIMIRVGSEPQSHSWLSPFFVVGFLVVLLAIAVWYRLVRARTNRPRS